MHVKNTETNKYRQTNSNENRFFFIHPHSLSINEALKNKKKKFAKTNTLFN